MSSLRLRASIALLGLFSLPVIAADYTTTAVAHQRPVSALTTGLNLNYSQLWLKNYEVAPGQPAGKGAHAFTLEVEWLPLADLWGKPAVGMGFGYAQVNAPQISPLHLFPVGAFFSYRFDFIHRQWLVPYVKGGATATFLQPGNGGGAQVTWNWEYGGGLALSLGAIDPYSVRHLDSSTGINDFFLTVEYVKAIPLRSGQRFDLSHEEFRFGVRFEI